MTHTRKPSLAEVIDGRVERRLESVHTAIVGRVERYDAAKQRVDVKPLIQSRHVDETGSPVVESMPIVAGVPVNFPGGGGFRVTFPIAVGDTGLLIFSEASLDSWLSRGPDEVDPRDYHRFHISDAVFVPGVRPFAVPLEDAPTDRATFGKDGGPQVRVGASDVAVDDGSGAAPLPTLATLQAFRDAVNAWLPVAGDGGASLKTALTGLWGTPPGPYTWPDGTTVIKGK